MPVALCGLDQRDRDAVLDGPAGVERLDLGHDLRREAGGHSREADERRIADRFEDGVLDLGLSGCDRHTHRVKDQEGRSQVVEDPAPFKHDNRRLFEIDR